MKILYGMTTPTAGEVRVFGKPVAITRPAQAIALGIGMVHQHFMLTPVMTVAENVVIGSEPVRGVFFDRKKAEAQVAAMIDEYNFHISATAKVETLSVGEQRRVEILKALYRGADLLILDEPTAVLTPRRWRISSGSCGGSRPRARASLSSPTSSRRPWRSPTGCRCCARAK
ncbi:MAG: ATP-binding cassette domain-containing protein [Flavonifractor plautii]